MKEVYVATRRTAAPDNRDPRYSQVVSQGGGVESFDDLIKSGVPFKQTISDEAIYAGNLRQSQVVDTFDTLDKKYPEADKTTSLGKFSWFVKYVIPSTIIIAVIVIANI